MLEEMTQSIPPNPRRVGYKDPIHGPLDVPLYMGSHIHQQYSLLISKKWHLRKTTCKAITLCSADTSKLKVQERFTIKLHLVAHESALQVSASFNINQQWKSLVTM